jgi:hypothetical protein
MKLTLRWMTSKGDEVLEVETDNEVDTEKASQKFTELQNQGYIAYKVNGPTDGEFIDKFDKEAEEIIMSPALMGG